MTYTDTGGWSGPDRALFSGQFLLTGTPDCPVSDGSDIVPFEVESGDAPRRSYAPHVL